MKLNIKKLYDDAIIPQYGSEFAAGLDINSYINIDIKPCERKLISTGISLSWEGKESAKYYLRVAARSGLSVKYNIDIGAGVIDYDYRGEIIICFINNDNTKFGIIENLVDSEIEFTDDRNTEYDELIKAQVESGKVGKSTIINTDDGELVDINDI